jgi:hypothetical protein
MSQSRPGPRFGSREKAMTRLFTILAALTCANACTKADECNAVVVFLDGVLPGQGNMRRAEQIAESMFASAGVKVRWRILHRGRRDDVCGAAVTVRIKDDVPESKLRGALAYALPYADGQATIVVMWDRVRHAAGRAVQYEGGVLAHVMVHEITHWLQGIARHSDTGVMRAHWNDDEYLKMSTNPLPFTPVDVDLLQTGLKRRLAAAQAKREEVNSASRLGQDRRFTAMGR